LSQDVDLQACIDGDPAAWSAFVDRYAGVIVAAVRRVVGGGGGSTTVDDLVQDVFVRIVRNDFRLLRMYDPDRSAITTWLTLVARSTSIDHLRRRRLDTVPLEAGDDRASEPPPAEPERPELPLHVLSERQRLVLRLLFDEDRPVPEVARMLGVDDQTVRSTKHKALTRLRDYFERAKKEAADGDDATSAPRTTGRRP
jgi:RNA polymerase sigma-70 factor (ECF subfamily)